jgi:hypothetical protein
MACDAAVMAAVLFEARKYGASEIMFGVTVSHEGYLDESGTDGQGPLVSMGGLVSTPERWAQLDDAWRATLNDPRFRSSITGGPLPEAKYSDCRSRRKRSHYEGWTLEQVEEFLADLARHICDHASFGVGSSVYLPDYNRIIADPARNPGAMADPYRWVMQSCLEAITNAQELSPFGMVLCEFDAGHPKPGLTERYFLALTDNPEAVITGRRRIVPKYSSAQSINLPALQAADILVGGLRWGTRTYLASPDRVAVDVDSVPKIQIELVLRPEFPVYGMLFTKDKLERLYVDIEAERRRDAMAARASSGDDEAGE